ncbi:hypothetical protein [Paraflavitalea sp. CAU 1676]|uniref:hypothetical protein n=1 Tax=Paraflavitalea sp. CAU 1676 TaxID=3032598 RepID=UPI0023DC378B|nr:hypothetical protein [Paraflavitalea sp. CAU 1676]MDF2188991.1 hypothetical protein [Paraflavitalea sp. CAU 1676]
MQAVERWFLVLFKGIWAGGIPYLCRPRSIWIRKKTDRQDIEITINSIPLPPNYRRSKNLDV